jgi:hypothetical protein
MAEMKSPWKSKAGFQVKQQILIRYGELRSWGGQHPGAERDAIQIEARPKLPHRKKEARPPRQRCRAKHEQFDAKATYAHTKDASSQ